MTKNDNGIDPNSEVEEQKEITSFKSPIPVSKGMLT